jgi:adenylylsulfate kinase
MNPDSTQVYWHHAQVTRDAREDRQAHRALVVWLTGLSGSGKSSVAHAVEAVLFKKGIRTFVLDGDNVRHGLCGDLGFSENDRKENLRRAGEVCKLFLEAGVVVLAAFISPYRIDRDSVRGLFPHGDFVEIFVNCTIDVCEQRDPKGIYKKARAGEIVGFTGISAPYEAPLNPDLQIDTNLFSLAESVARVVTFLDPRLGLTR